MSDHFDGSRFHNVPPVEDRGFGDLLRWLLNRDIGPWGPPRHVDPGPPPPAVVDQGRLRATWIGHATLLLQLDGLNILTDPIWSERASPLSFIGPRRVLPPGLRFEDLPPIHAVLVSHNHYDHMDLPTLRRLESAHQPRFLTSLGNRKPLESKGLQDVVELDWWQSAEVGGMRLTLTPARHFSSRYGFDRNRTLWGGFWLEAPSGPVYFAADTGYGAHFTELAERFGAPRLALLPIGAFKPRWFMQPVHMSPHDAVIAHRDLGAATSIAIHFGTFPMADDGETEPVELLAQALAVEGISPEELRVPELGAGWEAPVLT